jgi:hypothetical protein
MFVFKQRVPLDISFENIFFLHWSLLAMYKVFINRNQGNPCEVSCADIREDWEGCIMWLAAN